MLHYGLQEVASYRPEGNLLQYKRLPFEKVSDTVNMCLQSFYLCFPFIIT